MSAAVVPDPTLPVNPAGAPAPADRASQEETDWAQAQTAAAQWAKEQLDVVGIRPDPSAAPTPPALPAVASLPAAAPRRRRSGPVRRTITLLLALGVGLLLLAVVGAGGIAIGSGSSLRGGVGKRPTPRPPCRQWRPGTDSAWATWTWISRPSGSRLGADRRCHPRRRLIDHRGPVRRLGDRGRRGRPRTADDLRRETVRGARPSHPGVLTERGQRPARQPPHLTVDAHVGLGQVIVTSGQVPSPPARPAPRSPTRLAADDRSGCRGR